ncbi:LysR family transcriptional regulator [uncultured Brevibacillus sp.]|uniref:LysR family transcriptional regulator n=1 Tax=uncultured Brevibacillus sp. TaxID=169970 RepID=UPI0025924BC0|nr:LysR family transcriptional regulator [uncultured Brevibacillus sp.]
MLEIRHLHTFLAIVDTGKFTKASEQLGYAQSTITSHIQILEDELGAPLFDRLGKKVILTNLGRELVPYARKMLDTYKEIKSLAAEQSGVSGDIVIGAAESLSIYRLGEILKEYKRSYPGVNIILKNAICNELRGMLYTGEADLVFTIEPPVTDPQLVVTTLKEEAMVIIGAPETALSPATLSHEQARETIILSEKGCSFTNGFEKYLQQNQVAYGNPLSFSSMEAIKKCVMNGLGISFLPLYTVKNEIKQGSLTIIEEKEQFDSFCTQLSYHKHKRVTAAMRRLIDITEKHTAHWT